MLFKMKIFLWELGLIKMSAKELNLPTEKEFLDGLGDASQITTDYIKFDG